MKSISFNEAPDTDPICLAGQAEYVLAAIDEGNPARQALWVFLKASNERLGASIEAVEAVDTPPTWEGLVDPMEAASLDLFYVIALFETVHGEEDDPAMAAVGTLLRMAKNGVDEMCQAMIERVRVSRVTSESAATQQTKNPAPKPTRMASERKAVTA